MVFSRRPGPRFNRGRIASGGGAAAAFDPIFSISGGVLDLCGQHSEVTTTSAAVSAPDDLTAAAWTKTDCSATNATTLTVGATPTNPNVMQAVTNAGAGNPCIPLRITFQVKFVDIPWICVESRGSTAANRTWLDVENGTVGTSGASHSGAAIGAADGSGWRTVSLVVTINGGAPIVRIHLVTGDNVLTAPVAGTSIQLREDTTVTGWVYQTRCSSILDRVSGTAYAQATVDSQPGYGLMPGESGHYDINGFNALRGTTNPGRMLSSHAGVLSTLNGVDKAYTLVIVPQLIAVDATATLFGVATTAQAANGARSWGTVLTGNGRWRHHSISDAGAPVITDASADIVSGTDPMVLTIHSNGTAVTWRQNGAVIASISAAAHDPDTITADRSGILAWPNSGQGGRANAKIGTVKLWNRDLTSDEIDQVEAFVADEWGITL